MPIKRQRKAPPGVPKYHRLTADNRTTIRALRKEGFSCAHIAHRIGCNKATVSRELSRNKSKKGYRPKKAQAKADWRMRVKAQARRKMTSEMWEFIKEKMFDGWTPEQISGRCKRDGVPMVSKESIYKEYYRRQKLVMAGKSDEELPLLMMRRKRRKTRDRNAKKYRNAGRGKIPGRVGIEERPKSVESRARVGNGECDLINGLFGTGNLVTFVERMTRFTLIAYTASKEADAVAGAIIGMLASLPKGLLKTLTFDNGKEFAKFAQIEQALGVKVYFANPYHSWERGTNENRNGVVRKVLPKGRAFDNITEEEMLRIDQMLNDRPLKCLNWRTPREAFTRLLQQYILKSA